VKATTIFDLALREPELFGDATMPEFAQATLRIASRPEFLPTDREAVLNAWTAVGVLGNGCSAPPITPNLTIEDFLCRGKFKISWNQVPGATTYYAERVQVGFPWSLATPVIDAPTTSCSITVPITSSFHLRACNACGCSAYTPTETLTRTPNCY
jgi:hypothetical protein